MKPHKAQKASRGVSRAKLLIRRSLGWMTGFPDRKGNWISFPSRERHAVMQIGRDELRRATYSINKLRREYPRALPKIVGDVDEWASLHRSLLECLKPGVHASEMIPVSALDLHPAYRRADSNAARALMSDSPELRAVVGAFSWRCWLEPNGLRSAIRWLQAHEVEASAVVRNFGRVEGCLALVRLWELAGAQGDNRVDPLIAWLADDRLARVSVAQGREFAEQAHAAITRKARKPLPKLPPGKLGSETIAWLMWMAEQDERTARKSLELFDLLEASVDVDSWEAWWAAMARQIKRAGEFPRPPRRRDPVARKLQAIRGRLLRLGDATPPVIPAKRFFELLRTEATQGSEAQYRAIRKALEVLPVKHVKAPARLAFLAHWNSQRAEDDAGRQNKLTILISEFGRYLARANDVRRVLGPWLSVWERSRRDASMNWSCYSVDSMLLEEYPRTSGIRDFFAALSDLGKDVSHTEAEALADFLLANGETDKAAVAVNLLGREGLIGGYLPQSHLALAWDICGLEIDQFGVMTKALVDEESQLSDIGVTGRHLFAHWKDETRLPWLRSAILDGHLRELLRASLKGEVIRHTGGRAAAPRSPSPPNRVPRWAQRYPKNLHRVLRELVGCDPAARETASRILQKDFPDPGRIREQIAALERRLAKGEVDKKLAARVRKLESWLSQEPVVGEGRLGNLERKLRRAATRALVTDWGTRMEERFRTSLPRLLGSDSLPAWAEDMKILELLLPIGGLKRPFQCLVAELLKRRSGEPPWDLREVKGNRQFLESMDERGINMIPWLDDAPVLEGEFGERDRRMTFTLERDPLEVFSMGAHFQTCLSPGDFNYFSVFANAADVNKQVLYGRREDGKVAARCLLALTDEGGIVTFHPYCHDQTIKFKEVVGDYTRRLARAMKTVVLPHGEIPRLIAPDWYDDGPVDVTNQFAFLKDENFLRRLETIPLDDLPALFEESFAPLGLNEMTLPMILELEAMNARPELVRPLFPFVVRNERLSPYMLVRAVQLLIRCERFEEAERLSPRLFQAALAAHRHGEEYLVFQAIEPLARCSPTRALNLLKRTRPKGVRSWSAETEGTRLFAAAVAHANLRRPRQAQRLLETAIRLYPHGDLRKQCVKLLEEISADN